MLLRCTSFEQMRREIEDKNRPIVIFGAGVIGTVTVPEILRQYHLSERVMCYIDNNCKEQRKTINVANKVVDIAPVDQLNEADKNTAIIIAISRYAEVLEQLSNMLCTQHMLCFIMPMMCIHNFCNSISEGIPVLSDKPLIPKKIHYMWLGKKQIPDKLQKCIDSWEKYCPDYEIIRWDESNYDITKNDYMKQAYEAKAYGFVPDYARLDILYQHGGIYMDTDVEVVRNLEDMLYQQAFCGVEKWQTINFGGCSGAVKGHEAILKVLNERENISFFMKDGSPNRTTCGFYDTNVALKNGYIINGKTQNIMGMNIYASDYFHPYDYMSMQTNQTNHTYSIHWFNGGWLDEKTRQANMLVSQKYDSIYQQCIKNQEKSIDDKIDMN